MTELRLREGKEVEKDDLVLSCPRRERLKASYAAD